MNAYITIQEDLSPEQLKEISKLLCVKLGWIVTAGRNTENIFGVLPLPGFYLKATIFEYKKSDIDKIKNLLKQIGVDFKILIKEEKTISKHTSEKYKEELV